MVKQITELTLSDFPNVYTLNSHVRLVTNIPNLNPGLLGSRNRGYFIRVFNSSDTIPKIKSIYLSPQFDFYASDNTSSLTIPNSSQFKEVSSLDNNYYITTDLLGVAMKWFNGAMQDIVWAYFVTDETPHFTGKILNELSSSVTYSKDENDTITITAKDGYKIKDATLEYQPYAGAGNETLGNFTIADNKLTGTINIPDNVKNDSTINLVISGDTITDLEHINPSLKADNVSITITGNTVTLTANSGYKIKDATLDIGNSLFGDDTPLKFTVSPDKTTATVTITDQSLIDQSQQYALTVHTTVITDLEHINPSLKANNVSVSITGNTVTLTANSGYKIKDATLDIGNSLFGDDTPLDFTVSQDKTSATVTVTDDSLIDPSQEYNLTVHTEKTPTETPTPPAETQPTQPTETQPTPPTETQPTKPTETQPTPPTETQPTKPTETQPPETQPIETNYKVDITQIKDYIDYKTDGLLITLTAKQDVTINSLRAVADLALFGETHQLDNSVIKIADNKKSATITVPNDYNSKLGYTIVISGDFTKNTPIPTNPKATGTLHVYQLDDKSLEDFSTKAVETFNSGHNEVYDFQKFITQLYKLPFFIPETESTGTTNILTGWYTVNEPARLLNKNHYIKDLGNIKVLPVNNNGYDHNVTSCTLYLPFVSPISVSYETVLNHTINIKYDTDLAGAKTTVNIFVDKELYKSIQVSIIENLDLYNIYNDSINGTLSSILNNTLDHCYIRVEYNKPIENLVSYETLEHNKLSNYTNFVKTKNANVSCGTQQEQAEIENLLNGGIYIK